jgi:aminomethyltransferase
MSNPELKSTPLHPVHVSRGARMVEFGGWSMPVQYSSILQEHQAVRQAAGLFDISHMGEFFVEGAEAAAWLNTVLTNDVDKLAVGRGQYTLLLNERAGVIDDLLLYRLGPTHYLLIVNAAKIDEDRLWLEKRVPSMGVVFSDQSTAYGAVALQGPRAATIMQRLLGDVSLPARNQIEEFPSGPVKAWVARTGYTGEDGFEIFFPAAAAVKVWETLEIAGKNEGLLLCGLGARDTLRLEAGLPLNGNDLSPEKTPMEAGLSPFISLSKKARYPGKDVLLAQKIDGPPTKLVALRMTQKGAPPRAHYQVYLGKNKIGEVTSGTLSPTLQVGIGLAYVESKFATIGTRIELDVRGQRLPAEIVEKPFYKKL